MFVYQITHEALSDPLVIESSFERSERLVKWTAIQFLETEFGGLGYDWVLEADRMTVTASQG